MSRDEIASTYRRRRAAAVKAAVIAVISAVVLYIAAVNFSYRIFLAFNGVYEENIAATLGFKPQYYTSGRPEYKIYATDSGFLVSRTVCGVEIDVSRDPFVTHIGEEEGRFCLWTRDYYYYRSRPHMLTTIYLYGPRDARPIEEIDGVSVMRTPYGKNELIIIQTGNASVFVPYADLADEGGK